MNTTSRITGWVKLLQPNPQAKIRLFCLPYAGGWSQIYRPWVDRLSPEIELYAIELPGRGPRLSEAPITDLSLLVEQIAINIYAHLDRPFAFFGHSMGGLLCFELTKLLRRQGYPEPEHLFISAYRAPHVGLERTCVYNLPEPEFIEKVRRLEGTPEHVLANAELRELIFPALRADFQAIETYRYQPSASLSCPMTVFGGLQDVGVDVAMLEAWRQYTTGKFRLQLFNGNHFFLHEAQALMLKSIEQQLFARSIARLDLEFQPLDITPPKSVSLRSPSKW
ncbi:thioesterase II family protein [Chamaesiphon polymorphus]|uniref:Putative thioesterase n=1 Tax=Chamaesiphon polymorphus CCALA 037 TaxID=2107692 RepID=A0A2T1GIA7_9CYAN|nr:thioesterase II family protein [Chamaesiphon polymorphus]PSB57477.1 putative thioesterase [Chamaesiphon polymorphus CCALA 037]